MDNIIQNNEVNNDEVNDNEIKHNEIKDDEIKDGDLKDGVIDDIVLSDEMIESMNSIISSLEMKGMTFNFKNDTERLLFMKDMFAITKNTPVIDERNEWDTITVGAKHGNIGCNLKLGLHYYSEKDYVNMITYLKFASDYGIILATKTLYGYYTEHKQYYDAIKYAKKLYEYGNGVHITTYQMGILYENVKDSNKALLHYKHALESNDQLAISGLILASNCGVDMITKLLCDHYVTQKQYREAIKYAEKLYIRRNRHVTAYYMGDLYERVHDDKMAIMYYERALANGNQEAAEKLKQWKTCSLCTII